MSTIQSGSPGNQCALPTKADKRVKGGASALSGGTRFRPSNMFGNQSTPLFAVEPLPHRQVSAGLILPMPLRFLHQHLLAQVLSALNQLPTSGAFWRKLVAKRVRPVLAAHSAAMVKMDFGWVPRVRQ